MLLKNTYIWLRKLLTLLVYFECFNEMWKLVSLLFFIVQVFAAPAPKGMQAYLDGRIVGGQITNISNFPWQVSIQRSGSHFCGGSVYSKDTIITAAHCVRGVGISTLKVRAGSSNWYEGGVVVDPTDIKIHESYNAQTMMNDIAVIRLKFSLPFGTTIKSIALAKKDPADGVTAVVSGWGTNIYGSPDISATLQYVDVYIVSRKTCASSSYAYGDDIKPSMICAHASGKDACQGDSGGPLVSGGLLVGIVSWGYGCAIPGYPGVYVNVADFNSWIDAAGSNP